MKSKLRQVMKFLSIGYFKNFEYKRVFTVVIIIFILLLPITSFSRDFKESDNDEPLKVIKPLSSPKFWVVNFGTARTLHRRRLGFAAGMGGQVVLLGTPQKTSAFFTIPHAGFRYGLSDRMDIGLRLAPIPLPFSSVGPGFGVNVDVKYCFTNADDKVQFAVVLGAGGAHVLIEENTKLAYSPNAAALTSFKLSKTIDFTIMARYVNLAIPTATKGAKENFVNIAGTSFGLKKNLNSSISILPEVGVYYYGGKITGVRKNGPGFQYGLMLATSF